MRLRLYSGGPSRKKEVNMANYAINFCQDLDFGPERTAEKSEWFASVLTVDYRDEDDPAPAIAELKELGVDVTAEQLRDGVGSDGRRLRAVLRGLSKARARASALMF